MSSAGDSSTERVGDEASDSRRSGRRRPPRQLITFVDSQDPNSRSTIQRHTAYHSNAQRRDARLQSLRASSRPRVLEWQRRPAEGSSTMSSSTSSASVSPLPAPSEPRSTTPADIPRAGRGYRTIPRHPRRVQANPSVAESGLATYLTDHVCRWAPEPSLYSSIVNSITYDEACNCLLAAYVLACQARNGDTTDIEDAKSRAQQQLALGSGRLRDKLEAEATASSDESIQAVLLLIAYTADFGNADEVRIHSNALRTMVEQRKGSNGSAIPPLLAQQLVTINTSRFQHLTLDCGQNCSDRMRFTDGLPEM